MADETRIQTIDLRDAWNAPYKKRAKKAVWLIQEFVKRHTGAKSAKVAMQLNEELWARGAKGPPRTVKVQIVREKDDVYWAELEGVKFELPKKPEAKAAGKKEEKKEEPKAEEKPATGEGAKAEEKKEEAQKTEAKPAAEEKKAPVKKAAKKVSEKKAE